METRRSLRLLAALLFLLPGACDFPTGPEKGFPAPSETGDGWETAPLARVGMEAGPIDAMLALIEDTPDHLIHSVLIVKDGKLVFERYWPGVDLEHETMEEVVRDFDWETPHYAASISKSITSALVGIALDQGSLRGVGEPLFSFFPEYGDLETGEKGGITLEHLLSFTSGFDWNEHVYGFSDPRDSHFQMFNSQDPVRYLLGRSMTGEPGSGFLYNSGDTNLLGEIVRRETSSTTFVDFARRHFFDPLGIVDFRWRVLPQMPEMAFASGGVSLRPRDMAKLGQLYLDGGSWRGMQVVSPGWVLASTTMAIPLDDGGATTGYGYNWWLGEFAYGEGRTSFFMAAGWGGQYVFGLPELDLVVVFTAGGYYRTRPLSVRALMENFILEAVG